MMMALAMEFDKTLQTWLGIWHFIKPKGQLQVLGTQFCLEV